MGINAMDLVLTFIHSFSRQRCKGAILLLIIVSLSCGFHVPPTRHQLRRHELRFGSTSERENAPNDSAAEEKINGADKETSKTGRRCPDFPSFAFQRGSGEKRRGGMKVRVKRKGSTGENATETPSWVYQMASELPLEPGLFLDVANSARRTRLLKSRSYASASAFATANITCPPSLADLDREPPTKFETFWISTPARLLALTSSTYAFPFIIETLDKFVTLPPEKLAEVASSFGPGVSIIYGTFVSLTLSVLYNRQQFIQDDVAQESGLLTVICRNFLTLFVNDNELAVEAAQTVADQVRILVRGSRGSELTLLMYSDPYSRMLELIAVKECMVMTERNGELGGQGVSDTDSECYFKVYYTNTPVIFLEHFGKLP